MRISPITVPLAGLLLSACATATPPPRFSALDPSDPGAPEPAAVAPSHFLDTPIAPPPAAPPTDTEPMKHEHGMAASPTDATPTAEAYSCPMHPQVKAAAPGKCPICGMTLVKQPAKPREEKP